MDIKKKIPSKWLYDVYQKKIVKKKNNNNKQHRDERTLLQKLICTISIHNCKKKI